MTKKINFCILLVVGLALAACSSDDTDDPNKQEPIKTYYISVDASKGVNEAFSRADTRALTLSGSTLTATWATNEHVYVQGTLASNSGKFWFEGSIQPQSAGASTLLNGTVTLPSGWSGTISSLIGDHPYFTLQFPRSGDPSYAGQKGALANIAANYDYAIATNVMFDIDGDHITGTNSASFVNQQAIVKFTLIDKANESTKLSPTALTVQYGVESVLLTSIPNDTYTTNGDGVLFVAIPGFSTQIVTLTATVGSDTYTYTKSNVTFQNGKYYEITVKMTKQ